MAKELATLDVSSTPDLLRLAEEVRRTGQPRLLRRNGENLAVLYPVAAPAKHRGTRVKTEADREAFLSSAGGWKDNVDVEKFLEDNYESRSRSSRPPVAL